MKGAIIWNSPMFVVEVERGHSPCLPRHSMIQATRQTACCGGYVRKCSSTKHWIIVTNKSSRKWTTLLFQNCYMSWEHFDPFAIVFPRVNILQLWHANNHHAPVLRASKTANMADLWETDAQNEENLWPKDGCVIPKFDVGQDRLI